MADALPDWAEPIAGPKPLQALPDWAEPIKDKPAPPTADDNLNQSQLIKPEEAAKALKLGSQTNAPPSHILLDPKAHQEAADRRDAQTAIESNPNIRNYVQKSALNAAVSQGDYPALDRASKSMSELEQERMNNTTFGRWLQEAHEFMDPSAAISKAARLAARGGLVGIGKTLKGLAESQETPEAIPASPLYRIGQSVGDLGLKVPVSKEEAESLVGQVEAGAGTMAPYIATMFLNPVVGTSLAFMGMSGQAYDDAYAAAKQAGASEEDARKAAGWNATIGGALGALPFNAANMVKNSLGKIALSGGAFTALGEAQDWATAQIAKEFYDPNSTYSFDAKRALATLILGSSVGGAHVMAEHATAERQKALVEQTLLRAGKLKAESDAIMKEAQSDVEHFTLQKAVADLNETKTREMSGEAGEDFAESHTGLLGNVFVPAYRIDEIYKREQKVPGRNDGLFGWIPDLANRLADELDKGGEIKIPIKKYLANMAGTPELHKEIADEVRLQESGVTKREAKEAKEAAQAEGPPLSPLDRQISDLQDERAKLNTEQAGDTMVPHPDNLLLARALDVATDPKSSQLSSINAAKWALENNRPDIAQAIVDRAEDRVYRQSRVGSKVGMAELPRVPDAEKVRVHGEERDTTVGEHLRALYAGQEDINPLMQRTIDKLVDLVGDVPVRIRHSLD